MKSLFVVVASVVFLSLAGISQATSGGATLNVSPETVAAGDPFQFSGCGYDPSKVVDVTVDSPSAEYFFSVGSDAEGCIDSGFYTSEAGQYLVSVYQAQGNGNHDKLLASDSLLATQT